MFKSISYAPLAGPFFIPMDYPYSDVIKHACELTVFVQGEEAFEEEGNGGEARAPEDRSTTKQLAILTVHDVGCSAKSFIRLASCPEMAPIRRSALFLHVCVPGQEEGAEELIGQYPTMDQMAELLPQVLDFFQLDKCVAIGEGAGADTVCRFALNFPQRLAGIVLVHCTSVPHGVIENLRETLANLRLEEGQMNSAAWNYLLAHKFGHHYDHATKQKFMDSVRGKLNERNLSRYLFSFCNRDEFTEQLRELSDKINTMLVTGGKSPHNKNILHMYEYMSKETTGLMMADATVDVLREAPDYLLHALIMLCQRHHMPLPNPDLIVSNSSPKNRESVELEKAVETNLQQKQQIGAAQGLVADIIADGESNHSFSECKFCGKQCCWCNDNNLITPGSVPIA